MYFICVYSIKSIFWQQYQTGINPLLDFNQPESASSDKTALGNLQPNFTEFTTNLQNERDLCLRPPCFFPEELIISTVFPPPDKHGTEKATRKETQSVYTVFA